MTHHEPASYTAAHIEDALARDPRTAELGLHTHVHNDVVVLHGEVATSERLDAIGMVLRELTTEHRVVNEVRVQHLDDPGEPEEIGV